MLKQPETEHHVNAVCGMGKYIILCQPQYQLINVHDSNSYGQYMKRGDTAMHKHLIHDHLRHNWRQNS